MIPWTTEETFLLVSLWPTASATQISRWLNRSRSSICAKAMRLRHDDLLPDGVEKHFEVKPVQTRPAAVARRILESRQLFAILKTCRIVSAVSSVQMRSVARSERSALPTRKPRHRAARSEAFHENAERCQATPGRLMLRPPLRRCRGICETSRLKAAICALYLSCNLLVCWQLVFRGLAQRHLFEKPTSPATAAHHQSGWRDKHALGHDDEFDD